MNKPDIQADIEDFERMTRVERIAQSAARTCVYLDGDWETAALLLNVMLDFYLWETNNN